MVISYYRFKKYILFILSSVLALPFVIFLRLISPIKKITIEEVNFSRIGPTLILDWFLTEKKAGLHKKTLNLFCQTFNHFINPKVCNTFWYKIWSRYLSIIPFIPFGFSIIYLHNKLPGKGLNQIINFDLGLGNEIEDFKNGLSKIKKKKLLNVIKAQEPNLTLRKDELLRGYKLLEKINIPKNSDFVCIQNRDNIYLNHYDKKHDELLNWDWSHHNYRNSNINNYLKAAENLVINGKFVIFTGLSEITSKKKLPGKIIEYKKSKINCDFMDIFLASQCKFYICSDSGISTVPECFRKALVITNFPAVRRIPLHVGIVNSIYLLKKFYSKSQKRLLSFKEIMDIENNTIHFGSKKFKENYSDIDILENSPEEIDEAAQEMEKRLNGIWTNEPGDAELQEKFWAINKLGKFKSEKLLVGTMFLRKYQHLLN